MKEKNTKLLSRLSNRQRLIGVIMLGAVFVFAIVMLMPPRRSVAAYCKVYKTSEAKLANAKGTTYSVAIFTHRSSNAHDFVVGVDNLERVAPKDIEPDIKTLKKIFEKIDNDPSQALSASWSGLGAESSVKTWTTQNCGTE